MLAVKEEHQSLLNGVLLTLGPSLELSKAASVMASVMASVTGQLKSFGLRPSSSPWRQHIFKRFRRCPNESVTSSYTLKL